MFLDKSPVDKGRDAGNPIKLRQDQAHLTEEDKRALIRSMQSKVMAIKERYIRDAEDDPERLNMLLEYPLREGSNRRSTLFLIAVQAYGKKLTEDIYTIAAAIELSEDWILMLDDLEDKSGTRRAKKSFHELYGEPNTLNVAARLQGIMWNMVHAATLWKDPSIADGIWKTFDKAASRTFGGQSDELKFSRSERDLSKADYELYYSIVDNKTTEYTINAPMQLALLIGGASSEAAAAAHNLAKAMGKAFQLNDDIKDILDKNSGKPRNADLQNSVPTWIMIYTYQQAAAAEKSEINRIYSKSNTKKSHEEIEYLRSLIFKYGAIDAAIKERERYKAETADLYLNNMALFPDNDYFALLFERVEAEYRNVAYNPQGKKAGGA